MRVTAGVLGTLAVAACSGCAEQGAAADDKPGTTGPAYVRRAAERLTAAGTSRVRTTLRTTSGGTRVTITGRGRFDYARQRGTLTVTPPDTEHGGAGDTAPIVEVFSPGVLHMRNRGAGVPADKWVRLDVTTLPDGNLLTNGATDPLSAAELLRGAVDVRYEGRERVDGVLLRRFHGTGDLGAVARAAGPSEGEPAARFAAAAATFGPKSFRFDAWFDDEGRLRRVQHRFAPVSATSVTEMYDFGVPVAVSMPAPEDIYTGRIATP
ncbi:hypothetical protein [Streptomyces sp. TR06-5]|uniref:hypothetical protein n=1 Tax=unclassified Streptomyces TaxID=2593676 RepID=UPI0039A3C91B